MKSWKRWLWSGSVVVGLAVMFFTARLVWAANASSLTGLGEFAVLVASTTEGSIALKSDRKYDISHNGKTEGGVSAQGVLIAFSTAPNITVSYATATNKLLMPFGRSITIGPGISVLYYKGDGTSTFQIQSHERTPNPY